MSERETVESQRNRYVKEAYNFLNTAMEIKEDDANVHKWMAVIISAITRNESTSEKIKNLEHQKLHLMVRGQYC